MNYCPSYELSIRDLNTRKIQIWNVPDFYQAITSRLQGNGRTLYHSALYLSFACVQIIINPHVLLSISLSVPDFYTGGYNFTITDSTAQVLGRVGSFSTFHTACSSLSAMGALESTHSSSTWSATHIDMSRSSIEMQRSGSDYTLYASVATPEMVASPGQPYRPSTPLEPGTHLKVSQLVAVLFRCFLFKSHFMQSSSNISKVKLYISKLNETQINGWSIL